MSSVNMSMAITIKDPKWEEILAKIPVELIDPRDYHRLAFTLSSIAEGKPWSDIALTGLSKPEYVWLRSRSPEFKALAKEAEKVADEVRQIEREETAHQRAVEGEEIPVYTQKGVLAGTYRKASDKLMEILLRASDPAKYREPKADGQGAGRVTLQVNFAIPPRTPQPVTVEGEIVSEQKEIAGSKEAGSPGENGAAPAGNPGV